MVSGVSNCGDKQETVYSTRRRGDAEEEEAKSRPESAEETETAGLRKLRRNRAGRRHRLPHHGARGGQRRLKASSWSRERGQSSRRRRERARSARSLPLVWQG